MLQKCFFFSFLFFEKLVLRYLQPLKLSQGRCLAPLGRGKPHPQPCGWLEYRENVFKLASIDQRTQEILASRIIGCKLEDMSPEEDTIVMATRGPNPLRLTRPKVSPSKENLSYSLSTPSPPQGGER